MEGVTESLRRSAPQWSLAGDKELLDALQTLHERIIVKCQETNKRLDEMVSALDDTSLHLQNVNNKFSALSNSQFIESRVYDDDGDVLEANQAKKEIEKPVSQETELDNLKRSLEILEDFHETVTILCDSDSDTSDDEDIARVVLKPKDLYANRPLPHIIGSQAWKSKWHAGLQRDDSESDKSDVSEKSDADNEQYSESEHEQEWSESPSQPPRENTISSTSSGLHSEQDIPNLPTIPIPTAGIKPLSQSDVAAELARRLGGDVQKPPEKDFEYKGADKPTVRKLYKPEKPAPGNIFSDEPPPLESDQSDISDDDGDIFAEINRNQPYKDSKEQNSVADDLFGKPIFDVESELPSKSVITPKSTILEETSEPKSLVAKPTLKDQENISKKPIGGKSLFGANAENIGAAILNRKLRRPSTSDDDSVISASQSKHNGAQDANDTNKTKLVTNKSVGKDKNVDNPATVVANNIEKEERNKERDIFDDLFAKSDRSNKINKVNISQNKKQEETKLIQSKVDLFKTGLFDDIDDLFTVDVGKVVTKETKKEKSIFDDADDLFADVAVVTPSDKKPVKLNEKKSLFDDDEDLFSEVKKDLTTNTVNKIIQEKSIYDDENDDLFTETTNNSTLNKTVVPEPINKISKVTNKIDELFKEDSDVDLFKIKDIGEEPRLSTKEPQLVVCESGSGLTRNIVQKTTKNPNLFDDDDDEVDDLFLPRQQSNIDNSNKVILTKVDTTVSSERTENINEVVDIVYKTESSESLSQQKLENTTNKSNAKPEIFTKPKSKTDSLTFDSVFASLNPTQIAKSLPENIETNSVKKSETVGDILDNSLENNDMFLTKNEHTKDEILTAATPKIDENVFAQGENKTQNHNISQSSVITGTDETNADKSNSNDNTINKSPNIEEPASNVLNKVKNVTEDAVNHFVPPNTDFDKPSSSLDVFTDIFNDQPPDFEKPKEPKKSKNINALFDDDSDDEALFFKKNDTILDEKPELFSSPMEDRIFGLFEDEPPEMDIDLVQKTTKKDFEDSNKTFTGVFADNLEKEGLDHFPDRQSTHKDYFDKSSTTNNEQKSITSLFGNKTPLGLDANLFDKEDIFSDLSGDDLFRKPSDSSRNDSENTNNVFDKAPHDILKPILFDSDKSETEEASTKSENSERMDTTDSTPKKIGKLKPLNFNINVNSLLPGASRIKSPKSDTTDVISTIIQETYVTQIAKSNEELRSNDNVEEIDNKIVKSISFEGKPDSKILDNTASKERAKIQVKRRPSTRRARREAVKRSGIDFGDDTTDNSSSIDEAPKTTTNFKVNIDQSYDISENSVTREIDFDSITITNVENASENLLKSYTKVEAHPKDHTKNTKLNDNMFTTVSTTQNNSLDNVASVGSKKDESHTSVMRMTSGSDNENFTETEDASVSNNNNGNMTINIEPHNTSNIEIKIAVKTEVANDEEDTNIGQTVKHQITSTITNETSNTSKPDVKSKVVYVLNDEDIFNIPSNSVLDDNDYDDLFKTNKNNKPPITTLGNVYHDKQPETSADNDSDLFKDPKPSKSVKESIVTEKKGIEKAKVSFFESDDDDDELFMKKKVDNVPKKALFASDSDEELFGKRKTEKPMEKQIKKDLKEIKKDIKEIKRVEVKGSLFGDDDDDDLFSIATKKRTAEIKTPVTKPSTKDTATSAEPVFEDPLSLFGDNDE